KEIPFDYMLYVSLLDRKCIFPKVGEGNMSNVDNRNDIAKLNDESKELERIEIELLLQGIYDWCGYDFRDYSYPSLRRRIWHRVYAEKLPTVTALLNKVLHDPACLQRLIADFSINVT